MASFPSACQRFFTLVLLAIAASPLQAHARESRFFSKVSRTEPETLNTKPETQSISPSSSPSLFTKATTEKGYGLFGKEETYEYPPTTTNPTKSEPAKFSKEGNNNGYRYGAGEKQGMSDTRFLGNGKYFYDVQNEVMNNGRLTENNEGHETFYGSSESGSQYKGERYETGEKQGGKVYGTGEKQGMSDTRFMENGKYFYDLEAEKNNNNAEFYNTNKYENEEGDEEEEEEEGKYGNELFETEEEQGSVKYNEAHNSAEFYDNGKTNEYSEKVRYQGGSYGNKYDKEKGKGNRYGFKSTPNKFPKYEFDSMEEYEKYEEGRSHQKEYAP